MANYGDTVGLSDLNVDRMSDHLFEMALKGSDPKTEYINSAFKNSGVKRYGTNFRGIDPNVTQEDITKLAKEVGLNGKQTTLLNEHIYAQRQMESMVHYNNQYDTLKAQYEEKVNHINSLQGSLTNTMKSNGDVSAVHDISDQISNARKEAESIKQKLGGGSVKSREELQTAGKNVHSTRTALNNVVDEETLTNLSSKIRDLKSNAPKVTDEAASTMKNIEKSMVKNEAMNGMGKLGKFAVGAFMMYGLVQALNSNRGKQDNGQLYNPGGGM